eukprot:g4896.t1
MMTMMIIRTTPSRNVFLLSILFVLRLPTFVVGDFMYRNFQDTTGIVFAGNAYTSSCANEEKHIYGDVHSPNRETFDHIVTSTEFSETTTLVSMKEIETNEHGVTNDAHARVGHRDSFEHEPLEECGVRVRLTPSEPEKTSAIWHLQSIEVYSGFECGFRFQITDLSRACNTVKDRNFGLKQYKACTVHGGDGFAFVLHGDTSGVNALGGGAKQIGYGGIRNSVAVEFDTWFNPGMGDLFSDHVSVHGSGPFEANSAGIESQLGVARPHSLADGREHVARVRYVPEIDFDLVPYFTATSNVLQYLKDNEEGRRVGTLAIYVDDDEIPLLAMPINLSKLLELNDNAAFVGFTSSTGSSWEKHDILGWYCCESPPCSHRDTLISDHRGEDQVSSPSSSDGLDYPDHQDLVDHSLLERAIPDLSTPADPAHVP